jgi:hypothetical protein
MLANIKFRLFIYLLKWFCDETDQWDNLKVKTKSGTTWFVSIGLEPPLKDDKQSYEHVYREIK